ILPPPRTASAWGEIRSCVMALDSFPDRFTRSSPSCYPSLDLSDVDRLDQALRLWSRQIDRQQPVPEFSPQHVHPLGQHQRTLELARGDPAVQVLSGLVVLLLAADDELVLLHGDVELVPGKARDRERDAQALRLVLLALQPLYVVWRIAVCGLGHTIESALDL